MNIQETTREPSAEIQLDSQYSLAKILGIWAIVALPMPVVIFIIAPALISRVSLHPGILIWLMIIGGYVWQFIVSLYFLHDDLGTLRWSAVRKRIWLTRPRDPDTGKQIRFAPPGLAIENSQGHGVVSGLHLAFPSFPEYLVRHYSAWN
jgi:hypothetical protein